MQEVWLSSYQENVPTEIVLSYSTLYNELEHVVKKEPKSTLFICLGKKFSNKDFYSLVEKLSISFHRQGIKKGDRIAVILPNLVQFPTIFHTCIKMGYILVPINPLLTSREISNTIRTSEARILIYLDLFVEKINALDNDLTIERYISTRATDLAAMRLKLFYPLITLFNKKTKYTRSDKSEKFSKLLKNRLVNNCTTNSDSNDIVILLSTGGTTGTPKLAALSNKNIYSNAVQIASWVPHVKKESKMIAALPLFHSFGMTVCLNIGLLKKGAIILVPKYKSKLVLKLIKKYKVSFMPGVPIMFAAISKYISKSNKQVNYLEECFSGGTELIAEIQQKFEGHTDAIISEAYGLTEASPAVTSNPVKGIHKQGSIGIPLPSTMLKIINPETYEELVCGEIGEIAVQGPQVMVGYWKNEDETNKVLRDKWLLTGDLGKMDKDGYFFITGRKKEMITWCGFKIYPQEVEKVLLEHPAIKEVGVCGTPDGFKGEAVKAVVVKQPDSQITKTELIDYCAEKLAKFKVPKELLFTEELPKNFLGKVVRRLLNELS